MTEPTYDPEGLSEDAELALIRAGSGPRRNPEEATSATEPAEGYCLNCWRTRRVRVPARGVAYVSGPDPLSVEPVGSCDACAEQGVRAHSVEVQEILRKRATDRAARAHLRRVK